MSDPALYLGTAVRALVEKATSKKNLAKPTYVGWSRNACMEKLQREISELIDAIDLGESDERILSEAADVMAFAAMLPYTDDTT